MSDETTERKAMDDVWVPRLLVAAGLVIVTLTGILTSPKTHWEVDEIFLHLGVVQFNPLAGHPPAPGYPLLIGLGKALNTSFQNPFLSLVLLAFLGTLVGFVALALAFGEITESPGTGTLGALLFYVSPAMLVHSMMPRSDSPALAFFALALAVALPRGRLPEWARLGLVGVFCSAAIGCRPQYALAAVTLLVLVLAVGRGWLARLAGLIAFVGTSLCWLVPLSTAVGGPRALIRWESNWALSSVGGSRLEIGALLGRFVVNPWGARDFAVLLLLVSIFGLVVAIRRKLRIWVLLVPAVVHIAVTMAVSDPTDAVRCALPFQLAVALFLAVALVDFARIARFRPLAAILASVIMIVSIRDAGHVTIPRLRLASPPDRAGEWVRSNQPGSVVLYDPALTAYAELMLPKMRTYPLDAGLAKVWNRPDLDVWIYADGHSDVPGSQQFSWKESPEYKTLTRNDYRVVSVVPWKPARRYLPVKGVHAWHRDPDRISWRWLDADAVFRVPAEPGTLELVVEEPESAPFEFNELTLVVDGTVVKKVTIHRDGPKSIALDVGDRKATIEIRSSRTFVPAPKVDAPSPGAVAIRLLDLRRKS